MCVAPTENFLHDLEVRKSTFFQHSPSKLRIFYLSKIEFSMVQIPSNHNKMKKRFIFSLPCFLKYGLCESESRLFENIWTCKWHWWDSLHWISMTDCNNLPVNIDFWHYFNLLVILSYFNVEKRHFGHILKFKTCENAHITF